MRVVERPGFTMLDVLVSMTVVVVLISILLPSLGRVRETAHQVICRSNVRQIGMGIALYAEDNLDRVMYTVHLADISGEALWNTTALRLESPHSNGSVGPWDGLGLLYHFDYLPAPKLYYCPSHHGTNSFREYENEWGARSPAAIYGNYQYRGRGPEVGYSPMQSAPKTIFLSRINPNSAIVADSMRTQADFNHSIGANVLRANNSVDWYNDNSGRIAALLPRPGEHNFSMPFENIWRNLDLGDDDR